MARRSKAQKDSLARAHAALAAARQRTESDDSMDVSAQVTDGTVELGIHVSSLRLAVWSPSLTHSQSQTPPHGVLERSEREWIAMRLNVVQNELAHCQVQLHTLKTSMLSQCSDTSDLLNELVQLYKTHMEQERNNALQKLESLHQRSRANTLYRRLHEQRNRTSRVEKTNSDLRKRLRAARKELEGMQSPVPKK